MPRTEVLFYQEAPQDVPVLDWLRGLRRNLLRDGIHELRARRGRVHYRMLYFFRGKQVAVLACGLSKEARVPDADIDRAVGRKVAFEKDPGRHTFEMELEDDG